MATLTTHDTNTASPILYQQQQQLSDNNTAQSSSQSTGSTSQFFKSKNFLKLFSKKSRKTNDNCKKVTNKRVPYNLQVNDLSNTISIEILLKRTSNSIDYGFTISGYCPCKVGKVEPESIAFKAGILVGDLIIKINSNNVSRATSESIVKMIKNTTEVILTIYRNYKSNNSTNNSNQNIIPITKLVSQGDQAATCIINSTENDFFLSKSSDNTAVKKQTTTTTTTTAPAATTTTISSTSSGTNALYNLQQQYNKLIKTSVNPIESFKSDDFIYYAGGNGVSIDYSKKPTTVPATTTATTNKKASKRYSVNTTSKQTHHKQQKNNESIIYAGNSDTNDLPSPIPYLPPLHKRRKNKDDIIEKELLSIIKTAPAADNNLMINNNNKRSTLTDSDYKTQSSSTTDIASSSNDYRQINQLEKINTDFDNDENDDDFDSERMDACEKLLNLEETFIEKMQKGVQQYSRPLRHCMMINTNQHHLLFQNIEKILAISEYQLNQLISQDDSTLISMFNSIGKLYENKMRMSCEAFDIYVNGIDIAFKLLDNLMRMPNFSKFIQDSEDDINMDLKGFLLLPLAYVENVWKCLNIIKEKTNKNSCDYIPINTILKSLESYVQKSKLILNKYYNNNNNSIIDNNNKKKETDCLSSDDEYVDDSNDDDLYENNNVTASSDSSSHDFSKLINSSFLIYSSKLNYRLLKKNKWNKIYAVLFKDALAFMSKDFNDKNLNNIENYINTIIRLKDIVKYDFDLDNNEFQLIYTNYKKNSSKNDYYSINLKASSIEEKHTWKKLLIHRIQQSKRKN